jgi:hypothetical protein
MEWWWFGIKSPLGRAVAGGIAGGLGAGVGFYTNGTPLWLAPVCGVAVGLILYFVFKGRSYAKGS